jgi:HEAT repeat protein
MDIIFWPLPLGKNQILFGMIVFMPRSRKTVQDKLAELSALPTQGETRSAADSIKAVLTDRNNLVVAKAAELCAERLLYDLEQDLREAYQRFLDEPLKRDKNCFAKRAIARALVTLDCTDIPFFLDGIRYRQLEAVWGGTTDTAVDIRCSCAMGLAATSYSRTAIELVELLNDSEAQARIGAVRALSCVVPREAELLLRFKVISGDAHAEVIGECLSALLSVEPEESIAFVANYLKDSRPAVRELAALALGESRLEEALPILQSIWQRSMLDTAYRRALLRAVALHRSDAAFDWLLAIAQQEQRQVAAQAIEALAIYKHNHLLRKQLLHRLSQRKDHSLNDVIAQCWPK